MRSRFFEHTDIRLKQNCTTVGFTGCRDSFPLTLLAVAHTSFAPMESLTRVR
jgi:hypothetical protein